MNGRIDSINAMTETFVKERMHNLTGKVEKVGIDDACIFMGRFANGSLANFESTRYARGHKALYTFEINGENMSLFWDLHDLHRLQVFDYKDEGKIRGWKIGPCDRQQPGPPVHGELVGAGIGDRLRFELHAPGRGLHPGAGERQAARPDVQGRARNAVRPRRDPRLREEPEVGERGEGVISRMSNRGKLPSTTAPVASYTFLSRPPHRKGLRVRLVHLTSSTFFGGPERQMLGLAVAMADDVHSTFASFPERGRSRAFLEEVSARGFAAAALAHDFPRVRPALRELTALLRSTACDVLVCHGYKAHILGRLATRRVGIPAVAVSRGWTGESRRIRLYEWLDRRHLRLMDHVVCVSEGQAEKVRRWCRVPPERLSVIRNSARLGAFESRDPTARDRLLSCFPSGSAVSQVILAAGRLSPEKGFGVLVEAAATICRENPAAGVVIFGEGALRSELEQQVAALGLSGRVVLPGFRADLDALIGAADAVVLPSFTEGLPNVALEASAAGVPVVATAVGGTPEVIADHETGYLVPPGRPGAIAANVQRLARRSRLPRPDGRGRPRRMGSEFGFDSQAAHYFRLLCSLRSTPVEAAV